MKHLVITATGPYHSTSLTTLTKLAAQNACHIIESRMMAMGSELTAHLLIAGSWSAIAKFETNANSLAQQQDFTLTIRRTELLSFEQQLPYTIYITAVNAPELSYRICEFFANENINIHELHHSTYTAPHSGISMASLVLSITLPANLPTADLRERFMLFCDDLNADVVMEPQKF